MNWIIKGRAEQGRPVSFTQIGGEATEALVRESFAGTHPTIVVESVSPLPAPSQVQQPPVVPDVEIIEGEDHGS